MNLVAMINSSQNVVEVLSFRYIEDIAFDPFPTPFIMGVTYYHTTFLEQ